MKKNGYNGYGKSNGMSKDRYSGAMSGRMAMVMVVLEFLYLLLLTQLKLV